jgi:hypothetical protein
MGLRPIKPGGSTNYSTPPPPMHLTYASRRRLTIRVKSSKKPLNEEIFFHFATTLAGRKTVASPDEAFMPFCIKNIKRNA